MWHSTDALTQEPSLWEPAFNYVHERIADQFSNNFMADHAHRRINELEEKLRWLEKKVSPPLRLVDSSQLQIPEMKFCVEDAVSQLNIGPAPELIPSQPSDYYSRRLPGTDAARVALDSPLKRG
jgi:hypothetical protein